MKTRIVFIDGQSMLGKTKIFDWPFDQLPEKDNTISKDLIPSEILWANRGVEDFYKGIFESYEYLSVVGKNFFHDSESGEKVIEILIEI